MVARRGITVDQEVKTRIEQFKVQNGYVVDENTVDGNPDGGGIFIDWRGKLTLVDSIVQGNQAGRYLPSYVRGYGGGVAMSTVGSLIAYNSTFSNNTANGLGGGIYNDRSTVILNNCTISDNSAEKGGGLAGGNSGTITVNNSTISNNSTTLLTDGHGGGIYSFYNTLTVKGSSVTGNIATGEGGGIHGHSMTIENSSISDNQAIVGGESVPGVFPP